MCQINRRSDGKKYGDQVSAVRQSEFPYPESEISPPPAVRELGDGVSGFVADESMARPAMSYVREISCLQAKLHTANSDLEQSNSECVKLARDNLALKKELKHVKTKARKLAAEKTAIERRLSLIESDRVLPRPGPPLKPFSDLTPKHRIRATDELQAKVNKTSEERNILPTKLSAFLTHRLIFDFLFSIYLY